MNLIDVMKQALGALEWVINGGPYPALEYKAVENLRKAIAEAEKNQFNPDWNAINLLSEANFALHKRIAELEAEKAEPVAWMHKQGDFKEPALRQLSGEEIERGWEQYPLYTTPPQREWVGLTDGDVKTCTQYEITRDKGCFHAGAIWAEAKLKEKNHIASVGNMVGDNT
jgi:hypothetical protein